MHLLTVRLAQFAAVVLGSLAFGPRATAQTTPAWASVHGTRDYISLYSNARRVLDAEGNVYEVGQFSVAANMGKTYLYSRGSYDGYLGRYNPDGTVAWVRQFGSVGEDGATDVAFDAAGNAYVTGTFTHAIDLGGGKTLDAGADPGRKVFLVKYDPAGNPLWARQNDPYPGTQMPSCPPSARSLGVQVDRANHVNMTCEYGLATSFGFGGLVPSAPLAAGRNPAVHKVLMARFSADTGTPLSLAPILYITPSVAAGGLAFIHHLLTTPTGGTYLVTNYEAAPSFGTGLAFAEATSPDVLVTRYSATGQVEWARTFGGPDRDEVTQAATDAAGNLYVTGSFRQSLRFGSTTLSSAGAEDGFLVKYSPQGEPQWARSLASPTADFLRGLCLDPAGNVYVTGGAGPNAHFGPTALLSMGQRDIVVAAFTPKGDLSWLQQAGGPQDDEGIALGFTAQDRLRVFGYTGNSAAFDAMQVSNSYVWAGFMAEIAAAPKAAPTVDPETLVAGSLEPYPNPATADVHLPSLSAGTRVQLVDALGRIVRETTLPESAQLSVSGLAPGLYTLRATDKQGRRYAARVAVE